ncbi:hypothetical protein GCM10023148_54280 [Actinokineospora soli]
MIEMTAGRAAEQVAVLTASAMQELVRLFPGRPAHVAQFGAVVGVAARQARQVVQEPGRVGRDAELWRLAEPGYLRGICEHPVQRAGATAALVPVVLTWVVIGGAEAWYSLSHADTPADEKPAFFADWLAQPLYLSPVMLSLAIVLTVAGLMWRYHGPAADQRRADRDDPIAHRLEAGLVEPLAALRAALPPSDPQKSDRSHVVL